MWTDRLLMVRCARAKGAMRDAALTRARDDDERLSKSDKSVSGKEGARCWHSRRVHAWGELLHDLLKTFTKLPFISRFAKGHI